VWKLDENCPETSSVVSFGISSVELSRLATAAFIVTVLVQYVSPVSGHATIFRVLERYVLFCEEVEWN
jgi:hypothetical protein